MVIDVIILRVNKKASCCEAWEKACFKVGDIGQERAGRALDSSRQTFQQLHRIIGKKVQEAFMPTKKKDDKTPSRQSGEH
jgi:hypothetical protein